MPKSIAALFALLAAALPCTAPAAPARKPRLAVMEIRALGTEAHKADLVSEVALTEASSFRELDVIGRSEIVALIGFQKQKEMLGCADDSACVAEIGGALGVDYILIGSLGRLGETTRLDLRLVEAKKARVLARVGDSITGKEDAIVASVQRGVRTLLLPVARPGAPVAAAEPPPPPAPPAPKASGRRIAAWALAGTGVACAGGGVAFGLLAQKSYDSQKAATDGATYDEYRAQVKDRILYSNVLYGLGVAGLGAGAWLYFTGDDGKAVSVGALPLEGGAIAFIAGGF